MSDQQEFAVRPYGDGWAVVDGRAMVVLKFATEQRAINAACTKNGLARKRAERAARIRIRPCLCCQRPFESEGIHNRLCAACNASAVRMG